MRIRLPSTARLSGLRLAHVLGAGFGLVLALLLGVLAYSLWSLDHVTVRLRDTARDQAVRLDLLRSMRDQASLVYSSLTGTVIAGPDDLDYQVGQLGQARDRHDALLARFRDGLPPAGAQRAIADKAIALIHSSSHQVCSMADSLVTRVRQDDQGLNRRSLGSIITNTVAGHSEHWLQGIQALTDLQVALGRQAAEEAEADVARARLRTLAIAALAVAVGMGTAVFISRVLGRSVRGAVDFAERVARGELHVDAPAVRGAEARQLFQALSNMQDSLRGLVQEIRGCAQAIETASGEVASGNLDLSRRTEQTSSRLQETSALMRGITEHVRRNTASASSAHELATQASDKALEGGLVMHQAIRDMTDIAASSQKISDIVGVINGFAAQTNILALNAAVEAARAGDSGRGFAVVAAEVRTLSRRVTQAAMEIRDLIGASAKRVEVGAARVDEAGATMGHIVEAVQRVGAINAEISDASRAQSEAMASVGRAVATVDGMTQQNAALVEQGAAAAESLRAQARRLVSVVKVFRIEAREGEPASDAGHEAAFARLPAGAALGDAPAR